MPKAICFLFILLFSVTSFAGEKSDTCHHFKTGKFSYRDSLGVITHITRTRRHQTEVNSQTGMLTKSTINWVGECTYRLKQVWSNRKEQRKNNGRELTIQIIKIDGNRYEYTCNCNDPKNTEINGVVIKLSD